MNLSTESTLDHGACVAGSQHRVPTESAHDEHFGAFARHLAHEIRTPIGQIESIANVLLSKGGCLVECDIRRWLVVQLKVTRQMTDTVQALLELGRVAPMAQYLDDIDLTALCESLRTEVADERSLTVDWRIERSMRIQGHLPQVRVLMRNLLANALKYSRFAAAPRIEVAQSTERGRRCVSVTDNGDGFDMQCAVQLFRPFSRLHAQSRFEGTGLGLCIAKRVVDAHGGCIAARGWPGEGACFEFTLDPPPAAAAALD